jgi:hypothetical protein
MPTIKKESIASGPPHSRPRPRPRRKVSVATKKTNDGESSPHRTYAEVAATPSPPGHVVSPSHDSTPAGRYAQLPLPTSFFLTYLLAS